MPKDAQNEHKKLWGLAGATCQSFVVRAGDSLLEVVQYVDPVGKLWPSGYHQHRAGPQDRAALDALVAKGRSTLITGQMLRTLTGGLAGRAALARG